LLFKRKFKRQIQSYEFESVILGRILMRQLTIVVIGAGSTYTPELVEGFITHKSSIMLGRLVLMDIDARKNSIVGALISRMLEKAGMACQVVLTDSLASALVDADYVLAQIRVGGMKARHKDESIPLRFNLLGQETTGVGGFANALRTIPVMRGIAEEMERLCPNAWLINFSNPSGIIADAIQKHTGIKMIGLCNCPVNMLADVSKTLGREDFDYEYVGLNHLSWITRVTLEGDDVLPRILSDKKAHSGMKNIPKVQHDAALMETVGAIPSDYLNYYYYRERQVKHCLEAEKTRAQECQEIEDALLALYQNEQLAEKPEQLARRGGALYSTAAVSLIDALENDKREYHVVCTQNRGAIPFLCDDDVVEVKCLIDKNGVVPQKIVTPVPEHIIGMIQSVKSYERLTVQAAWNSDYDSALGALLVHPLIGDYEKARDVLDAVIEANGFPLAKRKVL
jgi:6-phospho-beta-glucosidase